MPSSRRHTSATGPAVAASSRNDGNAALAYDATKLLARAVEKVGPDRAKIRNYRDLAPDCMGAWLVYWRQNMPGLNNKQKDDDKKAMKNWWPFLFY